MWKNMREMWEESHSVTTDEGEFWIEDAVGEDIGEHTESYLKRERVISSSIGNIKEKKKERQEESLILIGLYYY